MQRMKFPAEVQTNESRLAFLIRAQEVLRLEHNAKGADFTAGKITKEEWASYKETDFNPKSEHISFHLVAVREAIRHNDTKYAPDLSDIQDAQVLSAAEIQDSKLVYAELVEEVKPVNEPIQ